MRRAPPSGFEKNQLLSWSRDAPVVVIDGCSRLELLLKLSAPAFCAQKIPGKNVLTQADPKGMACRWLPDGGPGPLRRQGRPRMKTMRTAGGCS
jgi:hypothetical protein